MTKTIRLDVHADDALLLIGVLDHAIAQGELNLADQRAGVAHFDCTVNDTRAALRRLKGWRDALVAAHPGEHGVKPDTTAGSIALTRRERDAVRTALADVLDMITDYPHEWADHDAKAISDVHRKL